MDFSFTMQVISAFLWSIVYILMIFKGFRDKTYCMPFAALCLNLTWEFIFAFFHKTGTFNQIICSIWFFLDCIIFYTFLRYGYKEFKKRYCIKKSSFYFIAVSFMVFSLIFMYLAPIDFKLLFNGDLFLSAAFIAYFQNLVMSILFVFMLLSRCSLDGQLMPIAICKWLGTLSIGILKFMGIMESNPTELFVILLIQVFDILYIYLIHRYKSRNY